MIDPADIETKAQRLESLLAEKFGAGRGPLERRLGKAGRRLPRWVHREAGRIAEARRMAGHPKLMRLLDGPRLDRAFTAAETELQQVDAKDRRRAALLGMAGALVFNLLLLAALYVAVIRLRGLVG